MLGVASLGRARIFQLIGGGIIALALSACGGGGGSGGGGSVVPAPISATPTPIPSQNQIVFTSDRSVALSSVGQTYQFSAQIETPSGAPVSGTLTWSSSTPTQVSVDQTGKASAVAAVGSATITVTAPGAQPAVATVIVAQPAIGTIIVPSSDVQSVTSTQAVLAIDSTTMAIKPGNIIVSGDKGQLLNTVTSVQVGPSTITVVLAPASLVQAFQQLNINVNAAATSQVQASLRDGLATIRSNGITRTRQISSSDFKCTGPSGNAVSVTLVPPKFTIPLTDLPIRFTLTHGGGNTTTEFSISTDVPFSISGGSATFQGTGNAGISCVATLGSVEVPAQPTLGLGFAGELTLEVGFNLSASGTATVSVSAPTMNGTLHIDDGIRFVNGVWQPIVTNTQTSTVVPGSMTFSSSISAEINPFARLDVGAQALILGLPAADFSFAYAQGTGELSVSAQSPFQIADAGYTGPSWNTAIDVRAGPELVLNSGLLSKVFDYIGISSPDAEWTAFEKSWPLAASPQIDLNASGSTITSGPVAFSIAIPCSTKFCPSYANDNLELWIFQDGAPTGSKLLSSTVSSSGKATAQWTPTASDNGHYSIVAYLYDNIFGAAGFPYASAPLPLTVSESSATPSPTSSPTSSPVPSPTSSPAAVPLTFSSLMPNSITTSTAGDQPTLTASGSNFTNVNRIAFSWSGSTSGPVIWNKGDSNWNGKVNVVSDSMMTVAPVVTESSDPAGVATWTVTLTDTSGVSKSQTFAVDYTPNSVSIPGNFTLNAAAYCNTNAPTAPAVLLNWTSSGGASSYDVYKDGALAASGVTGTSFDNNVNVVAGQTYTYYVAARNSVGSTASNQVTVAVPATVCPSATLTFTSLSPNSINTSTPGDQPTLTATGSNFLKVDEIVFSWGGASSGNRTWLPTSSDWSKVTIQSDTSMEIRPVVTEAGDPAGITNWTVTIYDSTGALASQTFTVDYTP